MASTVLIGGAAGVTYGALLLAGVDLEESGSAQPVAPGEQVGKLLAPNRDRLAICVDAVGPDAAIEPLLKAHVDAALQTEIPQHSNWNYAGYDKLPPPVVDIGCPAEPAVYYAFDPKDPPLSFFDATGRRVTEASTYKIFVFVIPEDDVKRLEGDPPYRLSAEEFRCSGDNCLVVTTGFYMSPDEVVDDAFISSYLKKAIGLDPPF